MEPPGRDRRSRSALGAEAMSGVSVVAGTEPSWKVAVKQAIADEHRVTGT
jgi:hypothetical protein